MSKQKKDAKLFVDFPATISTNSKFDEKRFSADIIATRERLDLTQTQAAKLASKGGPKISQVTIYDAELSGRCSLRTLPGICNLIGKPVQYYFTKK